MAAQPADDPGIWRGGLKWVEGAWMQCTRLEEVIHAWFGALADARLRAHLNEDTDPARSWRDSYDAHQPYDPQRPIRVPTFALNAQMWIEYDFFLIAVRNVLRAQERLPEELRPEMTDQRLLLLTRNIAEHWDEVGGRSADAFAKDYPGRTPGEMSATNKEVSVGGVPVSRVIAWLARVHDALMRAIEDATGDAHPALQKSMVDGDDALAWPPERRRERLWQVPQLDMEDWPTEEMPPKIAELMAMRFRNRRLRDGVD
jgi:hypothetical protein